MNKILFAPIIFFLMILSTALSAKPQIIFVHGWQSKSPDHALAKRRLETIFPGYEVKVWEWDAHDKSFGKCRNRTYGEAYEIAHEITEMSEEKRKKLIIVGHSLGGMIAIRTMKHLAERNIKIERGIFLGSAIPDNDPAIALAITASLRNNINIYNPQDVVLRYIYGAFNLYKIQRVFALGAFGYAKICKKSELFQIQAAEYIDDYRMIANVNDARKNHFLTGYLDCLEKNIKSADNVLPGELDKSTAIDAIKVPDMLNGGKIVIPAPVRNFLRAETMDAHRQWLLVRFYCPERTIHIKYLFTKTIPAFGLYCVFDPRARLVGFTHKRADAIDAFENVKSQLDDE